MDSFMKEEFLHYLWQFRLIQLPLMTTQGEKMEVMQVGIHNTNSGPDFLQAKIKIGDTLWAGNIELHLKASDWYKHHHEKDQAYNSSILHVVYDCDSDVQLENGGRLPCLELKNRFNTELLHRYEGFLASKKWIPCSGQLKNIPEIRWNSLYTRMAIERLESKIGTLLKRLEKNKNDWEASFYEVLCGAFGLKINEDAFLRLAESLNLKKVVLQQNNPFSMEALLFGQSGMLQNQIFKDEYPKHLQKEYAYLAKKHQLSPLPGHLWKYLRLRPANFPTIRISQLSALLLNYQQLFRRSMEAEDFEELKNIFQVKTSTYWETHYTWDKQSASSPKKLSSLRINLIFINVLIPFLFLYGKLRGRNELMERALHFLELLPAEKNKYCSGFAQEGLKIQNAFQSQALLHLKQNYCDLKKCLNCPIGLYLLS